VPQRQRGHLLATLLFTDIVGSTELAEELADRRWRELLARHHAIVRRQLKTFNGRELDTAGDGFFAAFASPADAVRCACKVSEAVRVLGIEIRAGLHMGEVELFGPKLSGVAVHIAARTMAAAGIGEVIVTGVVKELVSGGGVGFAGRCVHRLKGVPGDWHLYTVTTVDGQRLPPTLGPEKRTERLAGIQSPRVFRRARMPLLAGGTAALIALVVVLALLALSGGPGGQPPRGSTSGSTALATAGSIPVVQDSVLRLDPTTNTAPADIPVGAEPEAVAFSGGYLWVVNREDHTISRIDPRTDTVLSTQGGLTGPCNLAADPGGGVWVTNCLAPPYVVARMSRQGVIDETIPVPDVPAGVVFGTGDVWVSLLPPSHVRGTVVRIDPSPGKIVHAFRVGRGAEYLAFDEVPGGEGGSLWVRNAGEDTVSKIDAGFDQVEATISVGSSPFQVEIGGGFVWVNSRGEGATYEIDPASDRVVGIIQGVRGTMAAFGGTLWVANVDFPTLWRVDMRSGRVVAAFDLRFAGFLAAGAGSIWMSAPAVFDDQCCP